ncbi:hypothetical protein [Gelidibacter mesophilus]|uniref:hypothetical protein n=1 Tax=Gelidibacter mesophilus TaxID=169050 RepID=UPI0003F7626A|nr:hypothetical protein [Gelidibacter mesophilus]
MTFINDNIIPGNHGKTFRTNIEDPSDKAKLEALILQIDGVTKVIFKDDYPTEFTVHTNKVVTVNEIQEKASQLEFHAIAKGPFFPLF